MVINIPILSILLIIAAAVLGALAQWLCGRLGASSGVTTFFMLLVFGLVLVFGHIS